MDEQISPVPPELGRLSAFIDSHVERVVGPDSELSFIALCAAKHIFDWALKTEESSKPHLETLLTALTETAPPQTRSRARSASTAQRRSPSPEHKRQISTRETPLPFLSIEGMNIDQIWQQLDLRAARVCENLWALQGEYGDEHSNSEQEDSDSIEDEDAEMDVDDENTWEGLSGDEDSSGIISSGEEVSEEEDDNDDDADGPLTRVPDAVRRQQRLSLSKSPTQDSNLNDSFFDLATFNAETSEWEAKELYNGKLDFAADEGSTEESEVDLFGSVDGFEAEGAADSLELFYNDFFEPPPRTQNTSVRPSKVRFHEHVSVKKIKAVGKGMPVSSMDDADSDDGDDDDDDEYDDDDH